MSILASKAMLAKLSISVFNAMKIDKAVTKKTHIDHNATAEAGHYRKALISIKELEPIRIVENNARRFHTEQTLPWQDRGPRLLPAKNHSNYSNGMRGFKLAFESAVRTFVNAYPAAINAAKTHLGNMFNPDEYPTPSDIIRYFEFNVEIDQLPDVKDFRVDISEAEQVRIKKEIEQREQQRQEVAMADIRTRIIAAIKPIAEKLSDPKAKVYESYVENLEQIVKIVPALNIQDDPQINELCKEIGDKLVGWSAKSLRKDKHTRKIVSEDASQIMEKYNLNDKPTGAQAAA